MSRQLRLRAFFRMIGFLPFVWIIFEKVLTLHNKSVEYILAPMNKTSVSFDQRNNNSAIKVHTNYNCDKIWWAVMTLLVKSNRIYFYSHRPFKRQISIECQVFAYFSSKYRIFCLCTHTHTHTQKNWKFVGTCKTYTYLSRITPFAPQSFHYLNIT